MNIQQARKEVEAIRNSQGDYEIAHGKEDDLYLKFIEWVAKTGTEEQIEIADTILETQKLDFARHCA